MTLVAGRSYRFDLKGSATRNGEFGTLADPYLYGVHDADGTLVSGTADDNDGWGANARVTFTPSADGTYYVAAGGAGNGVGTYTLRARDVSPAEAPSFGAASYAFDLAENADGSTTAVALGSVLATDPDAGDTVTYSIEGGNDAGLFAIDKDTGALSYVGGGEDRETTASHALTVRASDGTLHDETTVTVTVTNVNEEPSFGAESYAFDLKENLDGRANAVALGSVSATDPDAGATLTYSIEGGNDAGLFAIDKDTGALTYVGAGEDRETTASHELTVRASDGTLHDETTVTVTVTNVNEEPSFGAASYAFDLAENLDGRTNAVALGSVAATDPDAGATLTYSIEGGNDAGLFAINSGTGALTYVGAGEDHETVASRELTVRASDGILHDEATVTVNVTDVAETPVGTAVGTVDPADDFTAGTDTAGTVGLSATATDVSVTGEIETAGDRDWFAVTLVAGKTYQFDLKGSGTQEGTFGTLANPYLYGVYDADGSLLAGTADDDGGWGVNARVRFTPTEDGTFYVAAGGADGQTGTYTLRARAFDDDFSASTNTAGAVEVGDEATGEVDFNGDRDWFAVTLEAGTTYRFDLKGSATQDGRFGTLGDPYLYGVHDADGTFISGTSDNDGGWSVNSRVTFTPDADGAYYVSAGAAGTQLGDYTLFVEEVL